MNATELLTELAQQGVLLSAEGDRLNIRAPKGVITSTLRTEISQHKAEILTLLRQRNGGDHGPSLPRIIPAPEERHSSFPLTDMQQAYWVGRTAAFEMGNVSINYYLEILGVGLDLGRLNLAWRRVIERHDMLRAVVLPDGQQQILEQVPPYQIKVLDLRGKEPAVVASGLAATAARLSRQVLPADRWPLFEVCASHLDQGVRLHISIDGLHIDAGSLAILFREWVQLYRDPEMSLEALELSYRDYVLAEVALQDTEVYRQALDYWRKRVETLPPPPDLPLTKNSASLTQPGFTHRSAKLDPETWGRLKRVATGLGITPSALLLTAYAEVLAAWSKQAQFTLNVPLFNRLPMHPQVNKILGNFTSLILLEVDNTTPENTFAERAKRLHKQLWSNLEYRHVSGAQVVREMARAQRRSSGAALPVVFTSLLNPDPQGFGSLLSDFGEIAYTLTQTPQVWLDHQVFEDAGALVCNYDAVDELFPDGLLDSMFDAHLRLLNSLAEEKNWQRSRFPLVPEEQLRHRAAINATDMPVPPLLLQTLFEEQAARQPCHPAVVTPTRTLTYQELDRLANQLGRQLHQMGVQPNTLVAVVMEKGWEQVVAVLGVLKAGAAYLPLDMGLPRERRWALLRQGAVQVVLTQPWLAEKSLERPPGVQTVVVAEEALRGISPASLAAAQQAPENLAYVIYTSGSTGTPKGVMIEHRGAVNTILDINHRFSLGPEDRVLALSALGFDLSVYDIFGTLAAGATIVMPESRATRDPARWLELIARERVTVWNSVPALMDLLVEYAEQTRSALGGSLRFVLLSGDWIPVRLPERIGALRKGARVVSLGGATEASIWSILYEVREVDAGWKSIPYGRPIANQHWHVLDAALEPRPVWVAGQLYIAGAGLARGYWRDEEKTRASFLRHPQTGERLYRTGDLGRYLPDGNIEILGREDSQVKLQGHRVELGEVEAALEQHPQVRAAVATAAGDPKGRKRLVAYLVPAQVPGPTADDLRSFLKQKLPDYMVPSAFVLLDALPLTPNGKVDRSALPDPAQATLESPQHTPVEKPAVITRIARLVAGVLEVDHVDPHANLLDLGADSIDIIRIANLLEKELGFRPKVDELYRLLTVAEMAAVYEQHLLRGQMSPEHAEQSAEVNPESFVASSEVILDPRKREVFKNRQPGLRGGDRWECSLQLIKTESDETLKEKYAERRSHRQFVKEPISLTQFSRFLSCLRQIRMDGHPKYLYASAGGLYPVQVYLHVKAGRIEGVTAGAHYYHPVEHRLILLSANGELDRSIHIPLINQPIFDEAAFSIFLIAQLAAIAPMYGEESMRFVTLEAGLIAQLLESSAPACLIGLCQIGSLDFERIRHLFVLEKSHVLVHSLLGGRVDTNAEKEWSPPQETYHPMTADGEREQGEL